MFDNITTNDAIKSKFGSSVYTGPFQGLKIPEEIHHKLLPSELIGLYESALHKNIGDLLNRNINSAMMIGGSNGYYPAGLAYLLGVKNMFVYEKREALHERIKSWFDLNSIEGLQQFGEATAEQFDNFSGNKSFNAPIDLIFIDVEGAEAELIDPKKYDWQANTDMIIEMHTFYRNRLANTITKAVKDTHTIEIVYDSFEEGLKMTYILDELLSSVHDIDVQPHNRWIGETKEESIPTSGMWFVLKAKSRS